MYGEWMHPVKVDLENLYRWQRNVRTIQSKGVFE